MSEKQAHLRAVLQALFVVFLWATSWVLIKTGLEEIPALTFAGLRYTLAALCLLPLLLLSPQRQVLRALDRRTWVRLVLLGLLLYTLTQGAVFLALALLPAVMTNLILSFTSVTVAIMGVLWLEERPNHTQWLGVVIATLGGLVYFYPVSFQGQQIFGVMVALLGMLTNAGAAVLGRGINRTANLSPLLVTFISMGVGSLTLLGTGIVVQGLPHISLPGWGIIAWLAVVNTAFAFTLWNRTLRTLSAAESSIINGTMIVWIPLLAVLFLGETVTFKEGLGLAVVAVGTLMVQIKKRSHKKLTPVS
jgi:drug/metabolite transporter (DMT)-like permease